MLGGQPYLRHDPLSSCNKALKAAIWFSATNTLTERQCHAILGRTRSDALQRFKRMVDVALAQADLFNTTDLATLQAFCTYLVSSLCTKSSNDRLLNSCSLLTPARLLVVVRMLVAACGL